MRFIRKPETRREIDARSVYACAWGISPERAKYRFYVLRTHLWVQANASILQYSNFFQHRKYTRSDAQIRQWSWSDASPSWSRRVPVVKRRTNLCTNPIWLMYVRIISLSYIFHISGLLCIGMHLIFATCFVRVSSTPSVRECVFHFHIFADKNTQRAFPLTRLLCPLRTPRFRSQYPILLGENLFSISTTFSGHLRVFDPVTKDARHRVCWIVQWNNRVYYVSLYGKFSPRYD